MADYHEYHRASSIQAWRMRQESWTDPSEWPDSWTRIERKEYPRLEKIALPADESAPSMTVAQALSRRESGRIPSPEPLTLRSLSILLRLALGTREDLQAAGARRHYPSAGARFPVECYAVALRCSDLEDGVYHYSPFEHSLAVLRQQPVTRGVRQIFGFDWIEGSRAVLMLSAVMGRSEIKYGERAYRFAVLEAGHLAQNLCLCAAALDLPSCAVGGFGDRIGNEMLGLDGRGEVLLHSVVLS